MAQARGLLLVYSSRGTLVPRTCARVVVASRGKACQAIAKTLYGPFLGHPRTKYLSQDPGRRSLLGRPPEESKAPARGACQDDRSKHKTPAIGACWEGRPRHDKILAATRPASRQGPVSDKLPGATKHQPRQGVCRGKSPPRACAPAHPPTRRSGAIPGVRGERLGRQGPAPDRAPAQARSPSSSSTCHRRRRFRRWLVRLRRTHRPWSKRVVG